MNETLVEPVGVPRARQMLERAVWAGRAFACYDRDTVMRIAEAAATAAAAKAEEYAAWAV